jgi:hypothetical protein
MRLVSCGSATLALTLLAMGCTTVSPDQCWPNTTGGFGGSGTLPIGAGVGATSGDFGSAPQSSPLDYTDPPNPCLEPESPCLGKCLTAYEVAAAGCARIATDARPKTCLDAAYAAYMSCAGACAASQTCTDMYVACQDKGYPCTRVIEGSLSLCGVCRRDCQKKNPYKYSECYKCGFSDPR